MFRPRTRRLPPLHHHTPRGGSRGGVCLRKHRGEADGASAAVDAPRHRRLLVVAILDDGLHKAELLEVLQDRANDLAARLAEVRALAALAERTAVPPLQLTDTDALVQVHLPCDRGGANVVPVLVIRRELVRRRRLHDVNPRRDRHAALVLQVLRVAGDERLRRDIAHSRRNGVRNANLRTAERGRRAGCERDGPGEFSFGRGSRELRRPPRAPARERAATAPARGARSRQQRPAARAATQLAPTRSTHHF